MEFDCKSIYPNIGRIASKVTREGNLYTVNLVGKSLPEEPFRFRVSKASGGDYKCTQSHHVQRSGLAGPHTVYIKELTEKDAIREVFLHGLMNFDPEDDGAVWHVNADF
ncbi:MAG: hypothetical protein ABNH16_09410 [Thalassolituus sp.]|jgi:hypothetical protein